MKRKESEEVKQLIESGFELELISFELDIPIQELKQLKKEIEGSRFKKTTNSNRKRNIIKRGINI